MTRLVLVEHGVSHMLSFILLACTSRSVPAPTPTAPEPASTECRDLEDGRTVCFPSDHVCSDPHGIGDGIPVAVDCWTGSGRGCNPSRENWPACAGGWIQEG